jgi:hypothetical protein
MTVFASSVLRPFPRPLTVSFRRRLPRARLLLSLVHPDPRLPFTRGAPPIVLRTSLAPAQLSPRLLTTRPRSLKLQ